MPNNELIQSAAEPSVAREAPPPLWQQLKRLKRLHYLLLALAGLVLCFGKPLFDLFTHAAQSYFYSHILLIPFISLYLIWLRRDRLALESAPMPKLAIFPVAAGVAILGIYLTSVFQGWEPDLYDYLALTIVPFVLLVAGACALFLGKETFRTLVFPLAFLLFMAPFPAALKEGIDVFFQHASAEAAYPMLSLATPVLRTGLEFQLPGVRIEVAPECSGIHSSLVLLITSLLAGELFLRSPWRRAALALAIIPLAILRNALRIFTIGLLCVEIGPEMLHSPIHHRGGPIFFALSLIPFFLLLLVLRRSETKTQTTSTQGTLK